MKERKILIAAILVVTVLGVSVAPNVQRWWKKDAAVTATAEAEGQDEAEVKDTVEGDEVELYSTSKVDYNIQKDRTKKPGTEENPFIILEIVPFEGYAEIGYMVGGCEPIDFKKVRYVGSLTEANNILSAVNSILGGTPFSVKEVKKYVDYYRDNDSVQDDPEENYPEGYLQRFPSEKCYGYFKKVEDGNGKYEITGTVGEENLSINYCGINGNYDFIKEYSEKDSIPEEYLNIFKEMDEIAIEGENGILVSSHLSKYNDNILYANYKGVYGYFKRVYNGEGNFQIDVSIWQQKCQISFCGTGGNYIFYEKENDCLKAYDNFYDDYDKPFWAVQGTKETILSYTKYGVQKTDVIPVSYASSTNDLIHAKIQFYAPLVYDYSNKNYFLKQCLYVPEEQISDYHIRVVTVTPEILEENQHLIDAADYINIADAAHVDNMLGIWSKYYRESEFSPSQEDIDAIQAGNFRVRTFLENDLSWDVTVKLLKKISIDDDPENPHAPLSIAVTCYQIDQQFGKIVEATKNTPNPITKNIYIKSLSQNHSKFVPHAYIDGTGIINNVAKLYMMLLVYELEDDEEESGYFYKKYIETGLVTGKEVVLENDKKVTTGCFNNFIEKANKELQEKIEKGEGTKEAEENIILAENAALYWNPYTFITVEGHEVWDNKCDPFSDSDMLSSPNIISGNTNISVRNNVFTYNSDCSLTQHVINDAAYQYQNDAYRYEPFQMIEFCEKSAIAPVDVLYYLLNQKSSSLNLKINGSEKNKIFTNVDYDSVLPETAIAGEIVTGEDGKLYGRVRLNVALKANTELSNSLAEITIYRDPSYDKADTEEREDVFVITKACRKEGKVGEIEPEPIELYKDYYYDVPLELLEKYSTEELKFSIKVYYRYNGKGEKDDPKSYDMSQKMYEYKVDEDGKVTKDKRRTLTFVRRAMFNLD